MPRRPPAVVAPVLALLLVLSGCSGDEDAAPAPAPSSAGTATADTPPATPTPSGPSDPTDADPPVRHRLSLPAIMRRPLDSGPIRYGAVVARTDAYTRQEVTYRSDGLTISGILLRPTGRGPFPGIVLNHGYIDPAVYVSGQGLAREQDWLARAGFAVLHTDYRGHAGSDPVPPALRESRLGYVRDAANAVEALAGEPWVDEDRMAMLGRSMGGGVTMGALVAYPGLVDAAVSYASVSSSFAENFAHFSLASRPERAQAWFDRFGTPRSAPGFYRDLSPRTFFDRIDAPVLAHHGTADEVCPYPWARATQRLMRRAGVDSRLVSWPGERHAFEPLWQQSIERTVLFLRRQL